MAEIKINQLNFAYDANIPILKDISLILDSTPTAIIGQNGAGKTTLVKLLKGLLTPSSGEILLNGKNIKDLTVAQLAAYIGLVFQNPNDQIFKSTVLEEVLFGPLNIGMSKEKAEEKAREALRLVGLENQINENPYDLGLSERKLIAIASILAMDTEVVILDEPTIAQDYASKEKIKGIIRKLYTQGKMVLTIIHDMDFVAECFERTVVLAQGKVLLDGPTKEVFSKEDKLKEAYLELPHVTKLCKQLGYSETYLTIEELVAAEEQILALENV
ncbi:MAG: ATP-binding cassette domain-containing protein [Cellulosilyticum sp.]|nr:ATP-binding cassette domain-containing protein [Cellulosilyticum sp.]